MKMLIGLTGKTGSGKSSAARIFENLGAFVADCDKIAHLTLQDSSVKENLRAAFTDKIFNSAGDVDRKRLGEIVFSDSEKLSLLNSIMHPAVVDKALELCVASGKDLCILDGSEIESSSAYKKCAHVIVVTADEEVRLDRIMKRDGIDRKSALMRMRAQKDYGQSAIYIENNDNQDVLKKEIINLYNKFYGEINAETCN